MSAIGPRLTRRQGLAALTLLGPVALLTACGSEDDPTSTATLTEEPPAPALDSTVAAEESLLIAHYEAVLEGLGDGQADRRAALENLRDQHVAHRDALGGGELGALDELPQDPSIASLISAEKSASKSRIRACVEATDPELARVLAFIAASEASHVPALKDLA